mgnify:CR=1 FL=1
MTKEEQEKRKDQRARNIVDNEVYACISCLIGLLNEEERMEIWDREEGEGHEIFEHWIVSSWLGEHLENKGEVVHQIGSLEVWGRATTGQAIYMDGVILSIVRDLFE